MSARMSHKSVEDRLGPGHRPLGLRQTVPQTLCLKQLWRLRQIQPPQLKPLRAGSGSWRMTTTTMTGARGETGQPARRSLRRRVQSMSPPLASRTPRRHQTFRIQRHRSAIPRRNRRRCRANRNRLQNRVRTHLTFHRALLPAASSTRAVQPPAPRRRRQRRRQHRRDRRRCRCQPTRCRRFREKQRFSGCIADFKTWS